MTFDEWWATLTPHEQKVIGRTNAKYVWLCAVESSSKVAQWMIERSYATGHGDTVEDLLKELEWQVREEERELCAQVCEGWLHADGDRCAEAIRARGEK
jgi:hypothetical protein